LVISDAIASLLLHRNEPNKIDSERTKKMKRLGPIPSFQLNLFRNGDCLKMGVCIAVTLVWARFLWCLHGLAISNAIASLLLHKNEPNKIDSERT
jgi:hypothetical protein